MNVSDCVAWCFCNHLFSGWYFFFVVVVSFAPSWSRLLMVRFCLSISNVSIAIESFNRNGSSRKYIYDLCNTTKHPDKLLLWPQITQLYILLTLLCTQTRTPRKRKKGRETKFKRVYALSRIKSHRISESNFFLEKRFSAHFCSFLSFFFISFFVFATTNKIPLKRTEIEENWTRSKSGYIGITKKQWQKTKCREHKKANKLSFNLLLSSHMFIFWQRRRQRWWDHHYHANRFDYYACCCMAAQFSFSIELNSSRIVIVWVESVLCVRTAYSFRHYAYSILAFFSETEFQRKRNTIITVNHFESAKLHGKHTHTKWTKWSSLRTGKHENYTGLWSPMALTCVAVCFIVVVLWR